MLKTNGYKTYKRDAELMKKITNDWVIKIPFLLDEAVREYKKSTEVSLTKSTTQGWSIVGASLFDVYSDYSYQKNSLKKDPENGFRYIKIWHALKYIMFLDFLQQGTK